MTLKASKPINERSKSIDGADVYKKPHSLYFDCVKTGFAVRRQICGKWMMDVTVRQNRKVVQIFLK